MKCYRDRIVREVWILAAAMLLVSTLLLGCQGEVGSLPSSETATATPWHVALAPGDVVDIKFYYTPRLDETQTVRPDGKIALQLVGEVEAQGLTPSELQDQLVKLYKPHLVAPEIAVIPRSLRDSRVFVGGQVMTPGIVQMPAKMSLLEAIMQAGGFDMEQAEVRNVVVIRHRDGRRYGYSVDLKPALEGDETYAFFLEPEDIVYVPRTRIAKVGQWVDQHINRIIPDTGFFVYSRSGNTTVGMGSYR